MRPASIANFISRTSSFLPRYSGVRPTINPATNTAMIATTRKPYSPAPTPPGQMQPASKLNIGTIPPRGVIEAGIVLTDPVLAPDVAVARRTHTPAPPPIPLPWRAIAAGATAPALPNRVWLGAE